MTVIDSNRSAIGVLVGNCAVALSLALVSAVVVGTDAPNVAVGAIVFILAGAATIWPVGGGHA